MHGGHRVVGELGLADLVDRIEEIPTVPPSALALIVASVTISAFAQIAFKLGLSSKAPAQGSALADIIAKLTTLGVLTGLALYAVGTLLWLSALSRVELSQAYPFVGLGFALTTLGGWWLFGDTITPQRLAGIALIVFGIVMIARS
jgi:multidrug transporter EmrE-like cation transporter